jgi:hypothetical protein
VGSSHYGTASVAPRPFDRKGFLRRKRQESGGKGLTGHEHGSAGAAADADSIDDLPPLPVPAACPVTLDEVLAEAE